MYNFQVPRLENQHWDQIWRCSLYQANLIYMESQQLQGQVHTFQNLDQHKLISFVASICNAFYVLYQTLKIASPVRILMVQSYSFGNRRPHASFQNPRTTPSVRKVIGFERKKKKKRRKQLCSACNVQVQRTHFAWTK